MDQKIDWLLEQWGAWARMDGTGKLVDTTSAMFASLPSPANDNIHLLITDDEAMQIESALSILKKRDPERRYSVLVMRNYYRLSTSSVANRLKHCRPKIRELERAGEAFVEARLV